VGRQCVLTFLAILVTSISFWDFSSGLIPMKSIFINGLQPIHFLLITHKSWYPLDCHFHVTEIIVDNIMNCHITCAHITRFHSQDDTMALFDLHCIQTIMWTTMICKAPLMHILTFETFLYLFYLNTHNFYMCSTHKCMLSRSHHICSAGKLTSQDIF
jgi:hypothetical protein